jgi:hypothetical protein
MVQRVLPRLDRKYPSNKGLAVFALEEWKRGKQALRAFPRVFLAASTEFSDGFDLFASNIVKEFKAMPRPAKPYLERDHYISRAGGEYINLCHKSEGLKTAKRLLQDHLDKRKTEKAMRLLCQGFNDPQGVSYEGSEHFSRRGAVQAAMRES